MAAELCHGDFEGDARAGGGFFKQHAQRCALKEFRTRPVLVGGFQLFGKLDDIEQFVFGKILSQNEVFEHGVVVSQRAKMTGSVDQPASKFLSL